MSLVDVDSWLTEYEACERLNHELLAQLTQRQKRQRLSPEYNRLTSLIQIGLKQFATETEQLKGKLSASSEGSITFAERERRQRQLEALQSSLLQLQSKFTNATRSDRTELLGQSAGSSSQSPWQTASGAAQKDDDAPIIPTTTSSGGSGGTDDVETLKRRQIDILEDQNRGLEVLSQTISRQRNLASQLGQEVEDQNDILDNLANTMESVDAHVHVETGNIGLVNRRDKTCGYWVVILVLFVAIVIVALL